MVDTGVLVELEALEGLLPEVDHGGRGEGGRVGGGEGEDAEVKKRGRKKARQKVRAWKGMRRKKRLD